MNIDKFAEELTPLLDKHCKTTDNFVDAYEAAMKELHFDFKNDSDQLICEYIDPACKELKEEFEANDEAAKDIYRASGLDEVRIQWRMFHEAKVRGRDWKKLQKLQAMQEELIDVQLHFYLLREAIRRNYPGFDEKYDKPEIVLFDER